MKLKSDYKRERAESQIAHSWNFSKTAMHRTTGIDFAEELESRGLSDCYFVSELEPKASHEQFEPTSFYESKSKGIIMYFPQSDLPKFTDSILDEWKIDEGKRFIKKSKKDIDDNIVGLPVPENIEPLLIDLLSDTGEKILHIFSVLAPNIRGRSKIEEVVTKLGDLQMVFGLAKKPYPIDTLNYEVYNEIQNKLIELIVAVHKNDTSEANKLASDLAEILKTIVRTNKDLGNSNIPLVTLHDTGRTIGGLRIFTPSET